MDNGDKSWLTKGVICYF